MAGQGCKGSSTGFGAVGDGLEHRPIPVPHRSPSAGGHLQDGAEREGGGVCTWDDLGRGWDTRTHTHTPSSATEHSVKTSWTRVLSICARLTLTVRAEVGGNG